MDTHSRKKRHQTENNADGAGPVPEPRPELTGITWQKESGGSGRCFFLADENATENLAGCWERWPLTETFTASAATWAPARR